MRQARISVRQSPTGELRISVVDMQPARSEKGEPTARLSSIATNPQDECKNRSDGAAVAGFGGLPRLTDFTKLARRRVREISAAIEAEHGKDNCRFLTGTLPGSTIESLEYIARYSGWLVKNIEQWVRDIAPGAHLVLVWELQKRGALHIHALVGSGSTRVLRNLGRRWRAKWVSLLESITKLSGVDMFARESGGTWRHRTKKVKANCQRVKLSVSRYLAKYLSKTASKSITKLGFCPSRWWGTSASSRELSATHSGVALSVHHTLSDCLSLFSELIKQPISVADAVWSFDNPILPWCHTLIVFTDLAQSRKLFDNIVNVLADASKLAVSSRAGSSHSHASQRGHTAPLCLVSGAVCCCLADDIA